MSHHWEYIYYQLDKDDKREDPSTPNLDLGFPDDDDDPHPESKHQWFLREISYSAI